MSAANIHTRSETGNLSSLHHEIDDYQKHTEIRIVLIGKTGAGKSTLGNVLLGKNKFKTEGHPMESTTTSSEVGTISIGGKKIVVLDTPGVMDTTREKQYILEELLRCTSILAPGPHVFLLVIRADVRFTEEETEALSTFCDFFGEAIYNHLIVVFTHKSALDKNNTTAEDCLQKLPQDFIKKYKRFKGSCIAVETEGKPKHKKKLGKELFTLVEEVICRNNRNFYSDEKLKAAESAYRLRIPKIQEKVKKEFEEEKGEISSEATQRSIRIFVKEKIIQDRDMIREEVINAKECIVMAAAYLVGKAVDLAIAFKSGGWENVIGTMGGWLRPK